MVDSEENYKFYLGVKGLTLRAHIKECVCLIVLQLYVPHLHNYSLYLICRGSS